jgi:hypothetical protein
MRSLMRGILLTGTLVVATGCATTPAPEPTFQTGPDAEVTVDGLVRVDNAAVPVAYRKPGIDLTPYTRFMLDPVEVAYQTDPRGVTSAGLGGSQSNFALTSRQMENFRGYFEEAVVEALTENDGYELTTEPGPGVLRISAALIDLVVSVPTQQGGRQDSYTRSYGLVTLVLELRDSQSGEIFARAADRRDPTRNISGNLARVSPAMARADTQRMFEHWAQLLRERLDALK